MTTTARPQSTSSGTSNMKPSREPGLYPIAARVRLRAELTRQRAVLLTEWELSLRVPEEHVPFADQTDQASNDFSQDLACRVKMRAIAKLKRIERALQLLRTKHYGCCRRCRRMIPYERLEVQPDARFCVPCLALVESRVYRN